jgi:hypothetical protein
VSDNTGGRARGPLSLDSPNNASEATRLHSSLYSRLGRVKLEKTEGRIIRGRLWAQNENSPILVENHKRDGKGLRECPERWSCGVCDMCFGIICGGFGEGLSTQSVLALHYD